jgi:GT2 family glycosyltransferase
VPTPTASPPGLLLAAGSSPRGRDRLEDLLATVDEFQRCGPDPETWPEGPSGSCRVLLLEDPATLPSWLQWADGRRVPTGVLLAWESPSTLVADEDPPAAAALLASWETTIRTVLRHAGDRPTWLLALDDGEALPSPAALRTWLVTGQAPTTGPDPRPSTDASRDAPPDLRGVPGPGPHPAGLVLPAHEQLATVLQQMSGGHPRSPLREGTLPEPTPWALALRREALRREGWATPDSRCEAPAPATTGDRAAADAEQERQAPIGSPWGPDASADLPGYRRWQQEVEGTPGPPGSALDRHPRLRAGPVVTVAVPVYRPDLALLTKAVQSVQAQTYPRFELCLCDDGSDDPALTGALAAFGQDPRVRVTSLPRNQGIAAATNAAVALGQGAWVAFLDQDDELAPNALEEVALAIEADPSVDLLYSDDDKIDLVGQRFGPQFKPDWSPDLLLSCGYLAHLFVIRRALFDELGGFRSAFDGSQDWDLALRATERTRAVRHLPKILYHWRSAQHSTAGSLSAKPWAHDAGRRAIAAALERRGEPAEVEPHPDLVGYNHVRRLVRGNPLVSVVIPFRDRPDLTQRCLDSFLEAPGHDNVEFVLVDNGSTEPETAALLRQASADHRVRVLKAPGPFNWAKLVNDGARAGQGELLLFLNNDVVAASPGWLAAMIGHAQRPEIGAVGARLVFPDGRLQHCGTVIGLVGPAGHVMVGLPPGRIGYMGFDRVTRNWTAVTGACLLTRREVWEEVGAFDETLPVAYNDVDFCLKLRDRGYWNVVTPLAELVHAESASRGVTGFQTDVGRFAQRWETWLRHDDPLFSPHLSHFDPSCAIRQAGEDEQWMQRLEAFSLPSKP